MLYFYLLLYFITLYFMVSFSAVAADFKSSFHILNLYEKDEQNRKPCWLESYMLYMETRWGTYD